MRYQFIQPGNEDEFEDFCVRFYRRLLKRGSLVRYAKRGESQDGIDIIDQLGLAPFLAIQCKHKESTKTLPPKDIEDEVALAEASLHKIDRYIIATTAKKSKRAQDAVVKLNQRPDDERPFTVEIHFWEEICTHLGEFGRAVAEFIVCGEQTTDDVLEPLPVHGSSYTSAALSQDEAADIALYPEIDALFAARKIEAAEHEISKLQDPTIDLTLTAGRRYAILRLKAKLALERSRFDEAAQFFTLAYETCPDRQQARQNRVLALDLAGQRTKAFDEAAALINEGMRSPFLITLLIRTSRNPDDLVPHQATIDELSQSDEEVNIALSERYLAWNQLALAEATACKAAEIAPTSAHALFACGMAAHHSALNGDWRGRADQLAKALRYYSDAIAAAIRDHYAALLPEIYINRGRVNGVVGNSDDAGKDFQQAVTSSSNPSLYAEAAVSFFLHEQDYDSAWELLPVLSSSSDEAEFLIAATEYHHAPDDEKRNRIAAMASLANRTFERSTEARFHCVQWAIEARDFKLARQCVSDAFLEQKPFHGNTLLAWIELEARNTDTAREFAAKALDSSSRSAHQQEISVLARLLVRLNDDEKALPLLEQAATPGIFDDDCRRLLDCAQRLKRHDILLRICADLRSTHQENDAIRKLEVELLSHYAPEQAFALASEFRGSDRPFFTAARNYLAVRLQKVDDIEFDNERLPSPDDFRPDEAYLIVTPYVETRRYMDAIAFVYQQLRKYFSEQQAHGQYLWCVLQYGRKAGLVNPEVIDGHSAIRLENLTTGQERWIVVEDSRPDPARNECSTSSQAGQTLMGKVIGDVVDLRGPSVQQQQERVVEIKSKYVYVFQDVIANFQHRFPGIGSFQSIHLGTEEHFDPAPLVESLAQRRQHVDAVTTFYHDNLCSLHFLAAGLGINIRQLMLTLTSHDKWFVRCVECSPQEFSEAAEPGLATKKVVLDLSAIVTIARLGAWSQLDKGVEYLMSRATSDVVTAWLHELTEQDSKPAAYSFLADDGSLAIRDVTPEQWQSECDQVQSIVSELNTLCTVKSSLAMSALDPQRREKYVQVLGVHTVEAMSIAKDENATLWTDDLFVGVVAEIDFGVKRIWTQLAFKMFDNAKRLEADTFSQVSAKLAAWNYVATIWNPQDIVSAGNLCDWNVGAWPLKECLQLIGKCPLPLARRAQLAIEFFRLLRRSTCSEFKQSAVVQATLNALGNTRAVQWMVSQLDRFFTIDIPTAEFLKYELSYWLRLR